MEVLLGVVSNVWTQFGTFVNTAESNPMILLPIAFGVAGATVGLFRKATRIGGKRRG